MTDITAPTNQDTLSLEELALYHLLMNYRATANLSAIPLSKALTTTAGRHVVDTRDNIWGTGMTLPEGANLHSWSDAPYYGDHRAPQVMWDAPERVGTGFTGNGYEISAAGQPDINAALAGWQGSTGHNNVIMNLDSWAPITWKSIGIGVDTSAGPGPYGGRVYHVWFSDTVDASGPALIVDNAGNDRIVATSFDDQVSSASGADLIETGDGADLIILKGTGVYGAGYAAHNISSDHQVGTGVRLSLTGRTRHDEVINGGDGIDKIQLGAGNDAFFLHDSFSSFHGDVTLARDSLGKQNAARLTGIEEILGGAGNDIIDLTSPDYTPGVSVMTLRGEDGDDVLWASHGASRLFGGAGNDVLFGGAGVSEMTGDAGADSFEFTRTSTQSTVTDFDPTQGDRLTFYNTGGAVFDLNSAKLTGDSLSIGFAPGEDLTITLSNTALTLDQITAAIDII